MSWSKTVVLNIYNQLSYTRQGEDKEEVHNLLNLRLIGLITDHNQTLFPPSYDGYEGGINGDS